jgi:hypothetical protein
MNTGPQQRKLRIMRTANEYFDKVYLINLDSRPDRLEKMKVQLDKLKRQFNKERPISVQDREWF